MPTNPKDARLRELQFLAKLARAGEGPEELFFGNDLRSMVVYLVQHGYVNGIEVASWSKDSSWERIDVAADNRRQLDMHRVLTGQSIRLRITHAGRIRLSELEQALQTGRDRDPFGILLGQRHIVTDLAITITSVGEDSPLTLAYLDANGFKVINDTINHAAGDEALKSYMSAVSMLSEAVGEAYRAGGDEVVVIMPRTTMDLALTTMRAIAAQLHREKMPGDLPLSLSCGIVTTTDPDTDPGAFLKKADEEQKRAKGRSRVDPPRPSVIAVAGRELEVVTWR